MPCLSYIANSSYAILLDGLHWNEAYGDAAVNLTAWFQIAGGHGTPKNFYCGTGVLWFILTVAAGCVAIAVMLARLTHRRRRLTYERLVAQSDDGGLRHACNDCKVRLWERRANADGAEARVATDGAERL